MPFFGRLRSWILSQGQGGSELILLINIRYVEACNVLLVLNLDELSLCFPSPARASSFQDWSSYEMFGAFLTNWGQGTKPFVHCPQTEIISKLLKELAYSPWCLMHCTCRCCGQQGLSYLIPTQIQKLQWSHVTFCRGGWGRLSLCSNCSRYLFGPDFCCCGQERGERWVTTSSNTPFQQAGALPVGIAWQVSGTAWEIVEKWVGFAFTFYWSLIFPVPPCRAQPVVWVTPHSFLTWQQDGRQPLYCQVNF